MLEAAREGSIVDRRYVTKRLIARGGMASVFEAVHEVSGLRTALKVLHEDALPSREARARLLRESQALGRLRHPNVVQLYDAGTCELHGPYLSMEMIEGRPLDGLLLVRRRLTIEQSVAVLVQLCEALGEAHRRGVIHRDVKPANVLISRTPLGDQVELIDFSIARLEGNADAPKLTQIGDMLGTIDYMSPEQLLGDGPVDARTDVYAAGVVLYECLTGEVPFVGPPTAMIARLVSGERPEPLQARGVDAPALDAVVEKALRFQASERHATPRDLALAALAAVDGASIELALHDVEASASILAEHRLRAAASKGTFARRQHARAPFVTPARILLPGGATVDGRTEDVSEGGLLVVTDAPVEAEGEVSVRFSLPTSGRIVQVPATTRWVRTHRGMRALGLRFTGLSEPDAHDIRGYVAIMTPT